VAAAAAVKEAVATAAAVKEAVATVMVAVVVAVEAEATL